LSVTAQQFAQLCAVREFPFEEGVAALRADYGLTEPEARECLGAAVRARQELDIADTHDDMEQP
jgi:hypothetical protein